MNRSLLTVKNTQSMGRRAFSLIEIVTVTAVVVVISVVGLANLVGKRSNLELENTTKQIAALLREAQSRSAAQDGGATWGVRFDNNSSTPFYALFRTSYSSSSQAGHYRLPTNVQFASSSVAQGSSLDITFAQISGIPSTSTSISVNLTSGGTEATAANVSRSASGEIFFDDFNRTNL